MAAGQTTLGSWTPAKAREDFDSPRYCVRFRRVWTNYYPGDVAAFPEKLANGLVARRIAEPVDVIFSEEPPPADAVYALRYPIDYGGRGEE